MTKDEIFDRRRAERYLLLARDLPGYNVQLVLKPAGTGPGCCCLAMADIDYSVT